MPHFLLLREIRLYLSRRRIGRILAPVEVGVEQSGVGELVSAHRALVQWGSLSSLNKHRPNERSAYAYIFLIYPFASFITPNTICHPERQSISLHFICHPER